MLGSEQPFLYQMVFAVRDEMKDAYPELIESAERIVPASCKPKRLGSRARSMAVWVLSKMISTSFAIQSVADRDLEATNLSREQGSLTRSGSARTYFSEITLESPCQTWNTSQLPGKNAFKLYDTFGLTA